MRAIGALSAVMQCLWSRTEVPCRGLPTKQASSHIHLKRHPSRRGRSRDAQMQTADPADPTHTRHRSPCWTLLDLKQHQSWPAQTAKR